MNNMMLNKFRLKKEMKKKVEMVAEMMILPKKLKNSNELINVYLKINIQYLFFDCFFNFKKIKDEVALKINS